MRASDTAGRDISVDNAVAMSPHHIALIVYTPGMVVRQEPALIRALRAAPSVVSVELRPPRAELDATAGMDAWIDTYHAVSGFVRKDYYVFLTDSAVGAREENNLRHLVINLGSDVPRDHVVPFLTTKHSMDFCLSYAERAWQEGFPNLVVLGGDRTVGPPRCVEHAWQLREAIREHVPNLTLGGWANPHADPARQASYLDHEQFTAEFFLTQVVSHHHLAAGGCVRVRALATSCGVAGDLRRLLLPQRESRRRWRFCSSSCRCPPRD